MEPEELARVTFNRLTQRRLPWDRFCRRHEARGYRQKGCATDLLAASDVAWALIDSGVVDEEWDLFKLFKEHRI